MVEYPSTRFARGRALLHRSPVPRNQHRCKARRDADLLRPHLLASLLEKLSAIGTPHRQTELMATGRGIQGHVGGFCELGGFLERSARTGEITRSVPYGGSQNGRQWRGPSHVLVLELCSQT